MTGAGARSPSLDERVEPTGTRSEAVRRRLTTVPTVVLLLVAVTVLSPLLLTGAALADLITRRRRWMTTRLLVFGWVYLAAETAAVAGLGAATLLAVGPSGRDRMVAATWRLQRLWAGTLFRAMQAIFRLEIVVDGEAAVRAGPMVVLMRHASMADTLLPAALITIPHHIRLRYVLKSELLSDPALDIAGHRLPNHFVRRGSDNSRGEVARIRALARGLRPDEGVLIYPEGTRFTKQKRERAIRRLEASDPRRAVSAARLTRVLPPRPAGTLALLDAGTDVVVGVHHGLDGFASLGRLWRGELVGRTVRVAWWRVPAAAIPAGREERIDWLYLQWERVDGWLAEQEDR